MITKKKVYVTQIHHLVSKFLQSKSTNKGEHGNDTSDDEWRLVGSGEKSRSGGVALGARDGGAGTGLSIASGCAASPLGAGAIKARTFTSTLLEILLGQIYQCLFILGYGGHGKGAMGLPDGPQRA